FQPVLHWKMIGEHAIFQLRIGFVPYLLRAPSNLIVAETKRSEKDKGMAMSELRDSLVKELGDIYDAEQQLLKALPKMLEAAASGELKSACEDHLEETEAHIGRLKE